MFEWGGRARGDPTACWLRRAWSALAARLVGPFEAAGQLGCICAGNRAEVFALDACDPRVSASELVGTRGSKRSNTASQNVVAAPRGPRPAGLGPFAPVSATVRYRAARDLLNRSDRSADVKLAEDPPCSNA
jgi:hypothetical protein